MYIYSLVIGKLASPSMEGMYILFLPEIIHCLKISLLTMSELIIENLMQ